jgi:hypothetical protein
MERCIENWWGMKELWKLKDRAMKIVALVQGLTCSRVHRYFKNSKRISKSLSQFLAQAIDKKIVE